MSQKRYSEYQSLINSFDEQLSRLAIAGPGRYRGFDLFVQTSALVFSLQHSAEALVAVSQSGVAGNWGAVKSNQGCLVMEDAPITGLTVTSNAGNAYDRIDLIVMNHQFLSSSGGQAATYSVVAGPTGGPVEPTPTTYQTVIGKLYIKASSSNLSDPGTLYTPRRTQDMAGKPSAHLAEPNIFTSQQSWAPRTTINAFVSGVFGTDKLIDHGSNSNFLVVNGSSFAGGTLMGMKKAASGTSLTIQVNAGILINHLATLTTGNDAYAPIQFMIPRMFLPIGLIRSAKEFSLSRFIGAAGALASGDQMRIWDTTIFRAEYNGATQVWELYPEWAVNGTTPTFGNWLNPSWHMGTNISDTGTSTSSASVNLAFNTLIRNGNMGSYASPTSFYNTSTGRFTALVGYNSAGNYKIDIRIGLGIFMAASNLMLVGIYLQKNSNTSAIEILANRTFSYTDNGTYCTLFGKTEIALAEGDYIDIYLQQSAVSGSNSGCSTQWYRGLPNSGISAPNSKLWIGYSAD